MNASAIYKRIPTITIGEQQVQEDYEQRISITLSKVEYASTQIQSVIMDSCVTDLNLIVGRTYNCATLFNITDRHFYANPATGSWSKIIANITITCVDSAGTHTYYYNNIENTINESAQTFAINWNISTYLNAFFNSFFGTLIANRLVWHSIIVNLEVA